MSANKALLVRQPVKKTSVLAVSASKFGAILVSALLLGGCVIKVDPDEWDYVHGYEEHHDYHNGRHQIDKVFGRVEVEVGNLLATSNPSTEASPCGTTAWLKMFKQSMAPYVSMTRYLSIL